MQAFSVNGQFDYPAIGTLAPGRISRVGRLSSCERVFLHHRMPKVDSAKSLIFRKGAVWSARVAAL